MEDDPVGVGAGLHLRGRQSALALASVVREVKRAREGARDWRAVHSEHGVEVGVTGNVPAHRIYVV